MIIARYGSGEKHKKSRDSDSIVWMGKIITYASTMCCVLAKKQKTVSLKQHYELVDFYVFTVKQWMINI